MKEQLNRPKRFGEVLDVIFTLSRYRFMDFLKIYLIVIGPIILLEMLVQISMGKSFFRDIGPGANWFEQIINSFADENIFESNLKEDLVNTGLLFLTIFFGVFATISVLYVVDHIRKEEDYDLSGVIKQSFTKFLPIIGASALLFISILALFIIIIIVSVIIGVILDSLSTLLSALFIFVLILGIVVIMIYLGVRLSFYIAKIAFNSSVIESFQESWRMTKGRVLFVFGLYLIFTLIIGVVLNVFEFSFGFALGNSILFRLIINLVTLITTMIGAVAYAVVYFDLQSRHDASDLKMMIEEYEQE